MEVLFLTSNTLLPHLTSPGLKLANPGGGSGDLHGFLSTSHHHLNNKAVQLSKEFITARSYSGVPGINLVLRAFTYMLHDGRDGCRVDRSLGFESLDVIQRSGVKQLKRNKNTVTKSDIK